MATITREKIRARITFADDVVVETPYIKSFSVNRQRGQISANFSATVEVDLNEIGLDATAGDPVIEAGTVEIGRAPD